jgi:hypothetical protein
VANLPFKISRSKKERFGHEYTCGECGKQGDTVGGIKHSGSCSLAEPSTDYPGSTFGEGKRIEPFAAETWEILYNLEMRVADLYRRLDSEEYVQMDDLESEISDVTGVKWTATGSTGRVIAGIGKTNHYGKFHLTDQRGVVVKIDPRIRHDTENTPVSTNIDELLTFQRAKETGTSKYFGDIIHSAPDGMWLAMEYCIPIYPSVNRELEDRDGIFDKGRAEYISPLLAAMNQDNWENVDKNNGNIGLSDDGKPVVIDYGTGPEYNPK